VTTDPILPHLLDLLADPVTARGLILAGGYGLRLKQQFAIERGEETLFAEPPPARATMDLDLFLRMELFVHPEGARAVRARLDTLGYNVLTPKLQFVKPLSETSPRSTMKVDLLSRLPEAEETASVAVRSERVSSRVSAGLHGHEAREAFAVEDSPDSIPVSGQRTDGTPFVGEVCVPNAYAWLNLKAAAAGDWLRASDSEVKDNLSKHVFDVLVLVAMLTEDELARCKAVRDRYRRHPLARAPRDDAVLLFGSLSSPGVAEIRRQHGSFDYERFWESVCLLLGTA
jgi:hypothetical protein